MGAAGAPVLLAVGVGEGEREGEEAEAAEATPGSQGPLAVMTTPEGTQVVG